MVFSVSARSPGWRLVDPCSQPSSVTLTVVLAVIVLPVGVWSEAVRPIFLAPGVAKYGVGASARPRMRPWASAFTLVSTVPSSLAMRTRSPGVKPEPVNDIGGAFLPAIT